MVGTGITELYFLMYLIGVVPKTTTVKDDGVLGDVVNPTQPTANSSKERGSGRFPDDNKEDNR